MVLDIIAAPFDPQRVALRDIGIVYTRGGDAHSAYAWGVRYGGRLAGHELIGATRALGLIAVIATAMAIAPCGPCAGPAADAASTSDAASTPAAGLASAPTTGFLAAPTDQIAVPGMAGAAEITPEGDLYTGWAEYELRFGGRLRVWNQPTRTLADPGVGELQSTLSDGPVRYTQTLFAVAVAGRPVAYETVSALDESSVAREARVAMAVAYTRGRQIVGVHGIATGVYRYERPAAAGRTGLYEQPGQAFSPAFSYGTVGRDLDRSGLLLARGPAAPSRPLASSPARTLTATHDARLFSVRLRAHGRVSLTWQIPLEPPAAGAQSDRALDAVPLRSARTRLTRMWRREEAGMMRIEVPEAKVAASYRAAIAEILESRYESPAGWVQATNRLQYRAFWIRDAAMEMHALDLAGLHAQAAQDLAFMDGFQEADGLFISRPGQYDGFGQALWALDQHAQLTDSRSYAAAQLGRMGAAIGWLSAATAADPLGLAPVGDPQDDELAVGHITGDDLWAAAGLRAAISDARLAGREALAREWQAVDDRFEASLDAALVSAVARTGHIPPVLDEPGGQDWGNYYAAYPVQVLAAGSPAVSATMAWAREHMSQGLATYDDGGSLHDYLGFAVFETELEAGERSRAVAGLYAELAHTTSTDEGWEWDVAPYGYRGTSVDMSPHGTFAGDYVALLRNLLVSEAAGAGVSLLGGASPAWLAPGQHISVTDAPTEYGDISFAERSSAAGETLTWSDSLRRGTPLEWTLPWWARDARVAGRAVRASTIALHGRSGSIAVRFTGHRPAQSYALAVRALDAAYRAHGRLPPLVAARR
jgi:hypothetical protein